MKPTTSEFHLAPLLRHQTPYCVKLWFEQYDGWSILLWKEMCKHILPSMNKWTNGRRETLSTGNSTFTFKSFFFFFWMGSESCRLLSCILPMTQRTQSTLHSLRTDAQPRSVTCPYFMHSPITKLDKWDERTFRDDHSAILSQYKGCPQKSQKKNPSHCLFDQAVWFIFCR